MSIDAVIAWVTETDEGLRLDLISRLHARDDGSVTTSPSGQPTLTIAGSRTWQPERGMEVWGGSGSVEIVADPPRRYERIGYTSIREAAPPAQAKGGVL